MAFPVAAASPRDVVSAEKIPAVQSKARRVVCRLVLVLQALHIDLLELPEFAQSPFASKLHRQAVRWRKKKFFTFLLT
jgi:hypothetical protein